MEKILSVILSMILITVSAIGRFHGGIIDSASGSDNTGDPSDTELLQDPVFTEGGILRSMTVSSPPAAELDFTPLSEEEYGKVEELLQSKYPGTPNYRFFVMEISAWGRFDGGTIVYIRASRGAWQGGIQEIGSMLFTTEVGYGSLWLYTGSDLVQMADAYADGRIPYTVLKAFHEAWYADRPELEALYCEEYTAAFLRTLLCNEHAELERVQEEGSRIPSGAPVQASLSDTWNPEMLLESHVSLTNFSAYNSGNLSRIESGKIDPKLTMLWRISEAIGIPLSEIFKIVEKELGKNFHIIDV
mgnify:CR=1 FL=1